MFAGERVKEVERLLAVGKLSNRQIASITGVTRTIVGRIADGTHRPQSRRERAPSVDEPLGPAVRCSGCGGRVYLPCVLCRVRSLTAVRRR